MWQPTILATILGSWPIQITLTCSDFWKFNVQIHFWSILGVEGHGLQATCHLNLQAPPRITHLFVVKKKELKEFWHSGRAVSDDSLVIYHKSEISSCDTHVTIHTNKILQQVKKESSSGFGLCAPVWFPFKGGEICYQMTDPAAIQWRSSAHISQEFPWLSCHLLHFLLLLQLILSSPDERDAIQKKTFTKWVNKHLKKVRYCNIELCIF